MKRILLLQAVLASTAAFSQYSTPRPIEVMELSGLSGVAVADFNGDGANDVVASGSGLLDAIVMYLNDGGGNFSDAILVDEASYLNHPIEVMAGDVDGDGDADVIGVETYTRAFLHRNDGTGLFELAPFGH